MQKANQSIGPHDREEHKRTEPKSIKLLLFPLCVLAQHKIYFKLFSNCWLKPRVSCLVCYATQWGRQPSSEAGTKRWQQQQQWAGTNPDRGQQTPRCVRPQPSAVCLCGRFAKCFHDILYNLCKWGKQETGRERERLLCSAHSYQQISKRPSSQRLIIPPVVSLSLSRWMQIESGKIMKNLKFEYFLLLFLRSYHLSTRHFARSSLSMINLHVMGTGDGRIRATEPSTVHCPVSTVLATTLCNVCINV